MTGLPTRAQVERIRNQYPVGTKVRMIHMTDPYNPISKGTVGTVAYVDDAGSVHMKWENGRMLAFIPGEDSVEIIERANGGDGHETH